MYASTPLRLEMIRTGGGIVTGYVEAWYAGSRVTLSDGSTSLPLHADGTNEIPVDGTTAGPRRSLTLTLQPLPKADFDTLAEPGMELRAWTRIEYLDGSTDSEPQGRFDVDVEKISYAPTGTVSITAPDRWSRVQFARFTSPRASTIGATAQSQISSLVSEVIPGIGVTDTSTSSYTVPAQTWDRDRDKAIQDLAAAAGLDVFFDRNGDLVIRDVPQLDPTREVFTVDASETGVLIAADRERNRQKTYNVVVVDAQTTTGAVPFGPQVAWDNSSSSPTFAGSGAGVGALSALPGASSAGPFGQRPTFYSSALVTSAAQAQAAAQTILSRVLGRFAQLTLSSVPVPVLDDGDTIVVVLPPDGPFGQSTTEVHLLDAFTVQLVPHKNPMPLSTRSTRPDSVTSS